MRELLQKRNGQRSAFTATFERFGSKTAYKGAPIKTALFRDVRDRLNQVVTDHLWFIVRKTLDALNLQPDDRISFDARVQPYRKGYRGNREDDYMPGPSIDYKLAFPSRVKKIGTEVEYAMPESSEPVGVRSDSDQMKLFGEA